MAVMNRRSFIGSTASLTAAIGMYLLNTSTPSSDAMVIQGHYQITNPQTASSADFNVADGAPAYVGQRFGVEGIDTNKRYYVEFNVSELSGEWRVEGPLACQCWSHDGAYMQGNAFLKLPEMNGRVRAEILWVKDQNDWILHWMRADSFKLYQV